MKRAKLVLAAVVALSAWRGSAEPPIGEGCELHIISPPLPTAPARQTAFVRVAGASDDPFYWGNVGQPTRRLTDLTDEDLRRALGLGEAYRVVRHTDRPITTEIRKSPAPLIAGQRHCYAELLAYDSRYLPGERNKISGREELSLLFQFREYADSETPRLMLDGRGGGQARQFRHTLKTSRELALADLHKLSQDVLADFGRKVAAKRAAAR